ncbi:hypothetical protein DFP72DRAFT_898964 [Ephemerocybe angulata]|uniref:Uncharacterized protein n=1 Tax=Ephemerocybe angulata TaxID=980116 RepID=A0A8H6HYY7_9AGAR|nr:hypothetical protein DFP72DRAFT_898964 [Tulosesus angulatus]
MPFTYSLAIGYHAWALLSTGYHAWALELVYVFLGENGLHELEMGEREGKEYAWGLVTSDDVLARGTKVDDPSISFGTVRRPKLDAVHNFGGHLSIVNGDGSTKSFLEANVDVGERVNSGPKVLDDMALERSRKDLDCFKKRRQIVGGEMKVASLVLGQNPFGSVGLVLKGPVENEEFWIGEVAGHLLELPNLNRLQHQTAAKLSKHTLPHNGILLPVLRDDRVRPGLLRNGGGHLDKFAVHVDRQDKDSHLSFIGEACIVHKTKGSEAFHGDRDPRANIKSSSRIEKLETVETHREKVFPVNLEERSDLLLARRDDEEAGGVLLREQDCVYPFVGIRFVAHRKIGICKARLCPALHGTVV